MIRLLSIVTATYNRGNLLKELYKSLLDQTIKEFEWIIVDDGSMDNTKEIVKCFIDENKINIRYFNQANKGKHQALNKAIDECKGELTFFVDSDDILDSKCVEFLVNEWNKIKANDIYVGIAGNKAYFNGDIVGSNIESSYIDADSFDFRYRYKVKGDKAEAFRTDILKQNKFPYFKNENFLTEATLYNRISDLGYVLRWTDEIIYYCEYREDGLTKKGSKNFIDNWSGTTLYIKEFIGYNKIPLHVRVYTLMWYFKMGIMNKKNIFSIFKY